MIDITGLSKAAVLAALYNRARPQGMGFLHYDPNPMTEKEAQKWLEKGYKSFDYLQGRVMKLSLEYEGEFEEALYDRDNGMGAAREAIDALRSKQDVNPLETQLAHQFGKTEAIDEIQDVFNTETHWETPSSEDSVPILHLGVDGEAGDALKDAVEKEVRRMTRKEDSE